MANNAKARYHRGDMNAYSLLITRPKDSANAFVSQLREDVRQTTRIICSPLIKIEPTGVTVDPAPFAGVIFTSANAVHFAPLYKGKTAYCVGETTARVAQDAGWAVSFTAPTAKDLIAWFRQTRPAGPMLHLAGRHRRGDVAQSLTDLGVRTEVEVLYDQKRVPLTDAAIALLKGEGRVVVPLFSPRTAMHFMDQVPDLQNIIIVAISDAVAEQCHGVDAVNVVVVPAPTAQEMRRAVEKLLHSTSLA